MAPRRAYGIALRALGHANPRVVALDVDVRHSTYSDYFWQDEALRQRFVECRIAEQNMLSCNRGLAAGSKLLFVSPFGNFLMRVYDQVKMDFISRFLIKLVGSHVGVRLAADGPSQMVWPDVAFFRAWATVCTPDGKPLLYLLQPADAYAAYALIVTMAAYDGYGICGRCGQTCRSSQTLDDVLRALQLSASDIAQTAVKMLGVAAR